MNTTVSKLVAALEEFNESLDRLACGDRGLLDIGTTAADVKAVIEQVTELTDTIEEGLQCRLTMAHPERVGELVDSWFYEAN